VIPQPHDCPAAKSLAFQRDLWYDIGVVLMPTGQTPWRFRNIILDQHRLTPWAKRVGQSSGYGG